jgi:hypothetical protein
MMGPWAERARWFLTTRGTLVGLALLVAGAILLGSVGIAYAGSPAATTVTEQQAVETFDLELATSAVVTGETTLFAPGERLAEPPVYLAAATPVVDLSVTSTVPDDRLVTVTQRVYLVTRAVEDGEVFWTERRLLAGETVEVTDGTHTTEGALNVTEYRNTRLAAVASEVGTAGRVETVVVAETEVDSGRYADRLTVETPLVTDAATYRFGDQREASTTRATPVERTVPAAREVSGSRLAGGTLLAIGGLGIAVLGRRESDPEAAATASRVRYGEWVSTGTVGRLGSNRVSVRTLGDLVDVAIDSGRRVVHDPDRGIYVVLDDGVTYTFVPRKRTLANEE